MNKVLLLVLPLLLAACGQSFKEAAAARADDVQPRLEQLNKAGTAAKTNTQEPAAFSLPEGTKLSLATDPPGNAILLHAERFGDKPGQPSLDLVLADGWLDDLAKAYASPPAELDVDYFNSLCDRLLALKYLVVVRTRFYADPTTSGDSRFSAGMWQADLLLYEIESGKCLGVLSVNATNSEKVQAGVDDPDKWLHSDLWSHAREAVNDALKPYFDSPPLG
jgi:hypothetical protein